MTTFYITTPIYYVNDVPHLGHAYTTIVADALARFHRMRGDDTRFLTGTDEHGQKVEEAANKRGLTPQQLVDQVAPRFDETWRALGIDRYRFIRTTSERHKKVVAELWKKIRAASPDDLYLASYQGWYCVGCEAFYTESQLERQGDAWCCTIHKKPVNWLDKERSWFFRLSKYTEPLLAHIAANPDFVRPEAYRNEIVAFLRGGLRDLSVSRTSFSWGIPAPEPDPEGLHHVIYVWMDALTNYLTDLCGEDGQIRGPDVDRYWPHAIHVIGKDILRFHAVYWPAFLMAAKLPLPKTIFAHGWWTVRGEKISKSMPATRIDPIKLPDALGAGSTFGRAIGIDAMRYYLLREVPLGNDGDFTFESLFGRFNAELANDLGNLINRSMTLLGRQVDKVVPAHDPHLAETAPHTELELAAVEAIAGATAAFEAIAPSRALEAIWKLVREANRYVDATAPWALAKDPAKAMLLGHVLHELAATIGVIGGLILPVLPTAGHQLRTWVGIHGPALERWPEARDMHRVIAPSAIVREIKPLFPRLDDDAQARILAAVVPDAIAGAAPPPPPASEPAIPATASPPNVGRAAPPEAVRSTIDDFKKIELRVGAILSAAPIPKAKKLLQLSVDLGEAKPRSIVAGIAERYEPAALVGKKVIVVANLEPVTLRGVRSEGMLLAAGDEQILGLSAIDADVPPGTRVR
jgi:methionyl-tRNA synthetase